MTTPRYRCPWCLSDTVNPFDILSDHCPCCGSDTMGITRPCEHRTGSTLSDLWARGVRLVRRDPWADGNYLELLDAGGFMTAWALVHSPLEWAGVPEHVGLSARRVPLWMTPMGGWEAYTGPTVEQGDAGDAPKGGRRVETTEG